MKILLVGLKTNDQAKRVIEEGEKRGHVVDACLSSELIITASKDDFEAKLREGDLTQYDLVYLWAVSKRRWDWFTTAAWLHSECGIKIINQKTVDPSYLYFLSASSDYSKQVSEGISFPKSSVIFSRKSLDVVLPDHEFPVIVKVSPSRKGKGIYKCMDRDEVEQVLDDNSDSDASFIIREHIPNDGDIRVFTVGYKAIGAMKRTPKEGDFRANISQGGSGEEFDLEANPNVRELAEKVAKLTRTEIAGVDIMLHSETGEPYVLETNPGPQFTGFEEYTDINAAGAIIEYFESLG